MPEATGHIVLTERAGHAVHDAVHAYRGRLGRTKPGKVKRTEFTYYTFEHAGASVGRPPPSLADEPQTVHALVYDVVRFSEMDPQKAWTVLTHLRETVVHTA